MERLFQLNFPRYVFRLRRDAAPPQIWDGVRKRWLVLTPEEWVRQHLIRFLVEEKGAFAACVSQERPVELAGTRQRADVTVTGRDGRICLVAECKAPHVPLDERVLAQAVRYNSVLEAPFILVTNGLRHVCCRRDAESGRYCPTAEFPDLSPFFRV